MKVEDVFLDICNGYSVIDWNIPIYIKHLDVVEATRKNQTYNNYIKYALSQGKEAEDIILKRLIESGKWSDGKEKSITSCEEDLQNLESKKKNIKDFMEIDGLYNAIVELKDKRQDLLQEKYSHITDSAEIWAQRESHESSLLETCYTNVFLDTKALDKDYLDYLTESEFTTLSNLYLEKVNNFCYDSVKHLCISTFFRNLFNLSETSHDFFGVPSIKLLYNQFTLLKCAETFSKVASEEPEYPDEFQEFPDKVLMWYFFKRNGGEMPMDAQSKSNLERMKALSAKNV